MQKEIEKLPETLEALDPKERLNVVCKLMPYVTLNGNIFNPYLRCFHTVDGKFLRTVDSEESDYLKSDSTLYDALRRVFYTRKSLISSKLFL